MEGDDQPFISISMVALKTVFPEWVGMRLEGDAIRSLDKLVVPSIAPDVV